MGKRSNFERRERDTYDTPQEAVLPLLRHLSPRTRYLEPCAGRGDLIKHLKAAGHICDSAMDIAPRAKWIKPADALQLDFGHNAGFIVTNPPWKRELLHPMIARFSWLKPTWLLFDADWSHTKQARPMLKYCSKIVSVGRVRWIEGTKQTGKDNCAWYLFDRNGVTNTVFFNHE